MRKSLWIVLAVIVVAVSAPNAYSDSFTYSYTDNSFTLHYSFTTAAIPAVTMETTVPASDLTASSVTSGCVISSVVLDANESAFSGSASGGTNATFTGCALLGIFGNDEFALADYSTPGTYVSPNDSSVTLVVTSAGSVAAPEPSSVALMLLGVGLVFVLQKRNSRGHQLAA